MFGVKPDTSVAFAIGKLPVRRVEGRDIAKTTARRATDAERWRYGVELRILGSRWRPQTRAPHYPAPEPYVYRKRTHSLAWSHDDAWRRRVTVEYEAWLAARDKAAAAPKPEKNMRENIPEPPKPTADVVRLRVAASTPTAARGDDLAERKAAAAALLRDIAGGYGPRRAHKLRAMAEWLLAVPAAQIKREG